MRPKTFSRLVWSISLPVMLAELNEIVLHVTDTIFLARVGTVELGAIAIADAILELFIVLPLGLVDGIQILTARHLGRRRPDAAGAVFNHGLALILALSLVVTAFLALSTPWLSRTLVQSGAVATAVERFLAIGAFGIPLATASFAYIALLVSLGRTRALVPATLILTATNCVLDYLLIFGNFGLPKMGIAGAALGSVGAEILTFLFLTGYLLSRAEVRPLGLFRLRSWNRKIARLLARISVPVSLLALVETFGWFVFFLILERMGADALAAGNVVYACYEVFRIPSEAFGETACSLVSRFIGRGQSERIGAVVGTATRSALFMTLPLVLLALLLPDWVLSLFTLDESLLALGEASLRVVALAMLVIIPAEMWFTAVLGTGDTPAALGIEALLTIVLLAFSYAAAIVFPGGLEVVWLALPLSSLICLLVSYLWMRSGRWRRLMI